LDRNVSNRRGLRAALKMQHSAGPERTGMRSAGLYSIEVRRAHPGP
jgi:hypothetical protein